MNRCKNCKYYANNYGYGQCFGQKNAPRVDDNNFCENFKAMLGNNDLISRSALIKVIKIECNPYGKPTIDFESGKKVLRLIDNAPSVPLPDFKDGYKQAILDGKTNFSRPQGVWIDYSEEGFIECPFCHKATTCEDNIDELHYCWNCGAHLRKGEEE